MRITTTFTIDNRSEFLEAAEKHLGRVNKYLQDGYFLVGEAELTKNGKTYALDSIVRKPFSNG